MLIFAQDYHEAWGQTSIFTFKLQVKGVSVIKKGIRTFLRHFGYEIHSINISPDETPCGGNSAELPASPPSIDPVWPLPRRLGGPTDEEIRREFTRHQFRHYPYAFEGGVSFPIHHAVPDAYINAPERHIQRFRHIMPYLIQSQQGSLKGKRILDIACNAGFWSIQCALLGAEVVAFDARPELVKQADLVKSIVGVNNVTFKVLDFKDMSPQTLNGTFDVALNLGFLYHVSNPLEALKQTKTMTRGNILLDTAVFRSCNPIIQLRWEDPSDIWTAYRAGIVTFPSKRAVNLMLKHLDVSDWFEIPMRNSALPRDYLEHRRVAWLIKV